MRKKVLLNLIIVALLGIAATLAIAYLLMDDARTDTVTDRSDPFSNPYIIVFLLFFIGISVANIFITLYLIHNSLIKDIKETLRVIKRVSEGETSVRLNVRSCEEFHELSDSINSMLDSIEGEMLKVINLNNDLDMAKLRAEKANNAKSAFFKAISHEIRTPMNAVIGMSELLSESNIADEELNKIRSIRTYSNILLGIVDDLLAFSRLADGNFRLRHEHYFFPALLENVSQTAKLTAKEKGIGFITEFPGELPKYLYGDAAMLHKALMNLLSNAVKFTAKGEVTFTLRINAADSRNMLEFSIRDTGTGIQCEDCKNLFTPSWQIEKCSDTEHSGIGIGLKIADGIIRAMDGELSVESVYGSGSTFKAEIPFETGNEEQAEDGGGENSYVSAPNAKVLLVDDININLTVGAEFLKIHDIIPDTVINAKEAIKKICEKDYDIVFMDRMMPEIDGGRASEIIRSFGGKYAKGDSPENLKIIALTASVSNEAKELMLKAGMDDFLPKPVTKQSMNRILMKWLPPEKQKMKTKPITYGLKLNDNSPFLKAAERINGLDIRLGLRRSGGTMLAFKNSLTLLHKSIPRSLSECENALRNERVWDFAVEAHGMKGSLAINGFKELSGLAEELENAAKSENAKLCEEKLPHFARELKTLEKALKELIEIPLETDFDKEKEKKQGDSAIFFEFIAALTDDIERFDRAVALERIKKANEFIFDGENEKFFESLEADLNDYDYDLAMERLQSVKAD
ncbi:MAG: ATP-binding protein [Oscillospiraceae bacterium]|nr:ATP-binding protein [Oscillospiraceae bacterium]